MNNAQQLAIDLLDVDGAAVETNGGIMTVSVDLDTDDRVSLADACQSAYEHGAEIRDVIVDGDRERLEVEIKPQPDTDY